MPKIEDKNVPLEETNAQKNNGEIKCFACGTKEVTIDRKTGLKKWRKRRINGRWDGKNYFCNKCDDKLNRDLSDKEKVIILSMIAARTFSKMSSIDLRDEIVRDEWKSIIDMSYAKLKELNLINLDINKLYDKSGIEHPVGNLFRTNFEDLKRKTKGLFKYSNKRYFLNIYQKSGISKDDIGYLLKLVIDEKTLRNLDEIYVFCLNISNDRHIIIFDSEKHIFSRPEYDNVMKDVILYTIPVG